MDQEENHVLHKGENQFLHHVLHQGENGENHFPDKGENQFLHQEENQFLHHQLHCKSFHVNHQTPTTPKKDANPETNKQCEAEGGLETPEKSSAAPSRIAQCRPAAFGQPADIDTILKPKKRRKVADGRGSKTDKEDENGDMGAQEVVAVAGGSESKQDDPDSSLNLHDDGEVSDEDQRMWNILFNPFEALSGNLRTGDEVVEIIWNDLKRIEFLHFLG